MEPNDFLGTVLFAEHFSDDADAVLQVLHRAVFQRDGRNLKRLQLFDFLLLIIPNDDGARIQFTEFLHVNGKILPDKIRRSSCQFGRQRLQHGLLIRRLCRGMHPRDALPRAVYRVDNGRPRDRHASEALDLARQMHLASRRIRNDAPGIALAHRIRLAASGQRNRDYKQERTDGVQYNI